MPKKGLLIRGGGGATGAPCCIAKRFLKGCGPNDMSIRIAKKESWLPIIQVIISSWKTAAPCPVAMDIARW